MPGTPPAMGTEAAKPMPVAILQRALSTADIRLARLIATRLSLAACTGAAAWLFDLFRGTRYQAMLADGAAEFSLVINILPGMDPVLGTILTPAQIVGGLALAGLVIWNRLV